MRRSLQIFLNPRLYNNGKSEGGLAAFYTPQIYLVYQALTRIESVIQL